MAYGYLRVEFADDRPVYLRGADEPAGVTNQLIRLQPGRYDVRLRQPKNYKPEFLRPYVLESRRSKPTVVRFTKNPIKVFVSYSHKDAEWLESFIEMLAPIIKRDKVEIWSDKVIEPGRKWRREIRTALETSQAAVLLVSKNFLASEFITKNELPRIINGAENEDLQIFWIYVGYAMWEKTVISDYQAAHDVSLPLEALPRAKQNEQLLIAAKAIDRAVT